MNSEHIDKEITILENIYNNKEKVRQRDLAHIAGISLGMTNTIMKRLVNKGFVIAKKINHRNIHYAVTPAGINAIMRRSYRFVKRTIKNIVLYKEKIEQLIVDAKSRGYSTIVLVGKSDLDFIIEHYSGQQGLEYRYVADLTQAEEENDLPSTFFILSENRRSVSSLPAGSSIPLFEKLQIT